MNNLSSIRSATIIAPHPDDETIGAFGLIRTLRDHEADVNVVVVSDGSASHRNSRAWPKPRLAAQRKSETITAMALAGLDKRAIRFLGLVDGGLHELSYDEKTKVLDAATRAKADLLIIPEPIDDHPDHRAIGQLLAYCRPFFTIWAYRVWPASNIGPEDEIRYELGMHQALKRKALGLYRSQLGLIDDDPGGFTISPELFETFAGPVERFRRIA